MEETRRQLSPSGRRSVKKYASKVFRESSISAVSTIITSRSPHRRWFRLIVFLLFAVGFLYQCIKFLTYVFQYPTVVTIEITNPQQYLAPAFTICNNNLIKRSLFCEKYPNSCMKPDEEFCKDYPKFCRSSHNKIVKHEVLVNLSGTVQQEEDILKLNLASRDFLHGKISDDYSDEPASPFLLSREEGPSISYLFNYSSYIVCYRLNDRVNNNQHPLISSADVLKWDYPKHLFVLNIDKDDMLYPHINPGVFFSVHSPFVAVNPAADGTFMAPGKLYKIIVSLEEEHLLPHPYKTDCINYTESWQKNGKSGPRSQEMCREKCWADLVTLYSECRLIENYYPSEKRICTKDDEKIIKDIDGEELKAKLKDCYELCKNDCWKVKYNYKVQEREITERIERDLSEKANEIQIHIEIEDSEVFTVHYRPQFQEVEAFSYIGGFIGIWLGVSLVHCVDFVESVFRILRFYCRKEMPSCKRKQMAEV